MERDPLLRSTIVAVGVFDRAPEWPVLLERIDRATRLAPEFRDVLVPSPLGLVPPRWETDPAFDLSWHVRRMAAPAPHTLAPVLEFARTTGMTAFDPARPLWEFTLVEGLQGGRAALVMKVHHSLTDGIGGIQIAAHVVDLERELSDPGAMPPVPSGHRLSIAEQMRDTLEYNARRAGGTARSLSRGASHALRHPSRAVSDLVRTARSVGRMVQPVSHTLSPIMTQRKLLWHYDVLDVPLSELRDAAHNVGGTLNDGFVGGIAGGLARYHERHDAHVEELRLTMPISVRSESDPEGGNRITLARFKVPVGIEDPAARMTAIDELCRSWRHEPAIPYSDVIAGAMNLLPHAVTGSMLKHIDFLASNVPGFDLPVYLAGAELESFYGFGPTIGSAANVTLMSYRDTCNVGVTTDAGAVPDPGVLMDCLREGFEEILDLSGDHRPVVLPVSGVVP
ncbi:MAG: DUF1298 domain-containing protein [Actinobacteria bacterium]|nr:MAG: DUF1298 domain-containing protein [Actinomycetota bacterium]RIK07353.1 MAG: diacylglycerol O-acyltransferase [Acidobacteriota bacterium]